MGAAVNPTIGQDGLIGVGKSRLTQNYREFLRAVPLLGLFVLANR